MKIRILSDLHLESYPFQYVAGSEDVLILAGDIHGRNCHHEFLETIPEHIQVLMVAGNHEYYNANVTNVKNYFINLQKYFANFTFLDNDVISLGDVSFYGGTMFTDFELYGTNDAHFAKREARRGIADFAYIQDWSVEQHIKEHQLFRQELAFFLHVTQSRKRVVISHFMPSERCCDPKFAGSVMNPYFASDMSDVMGWQGLWVHGHGHSSVDFLEGDTRVIANPRGYGNENKKGFVNNLIVEI